MFAKADRLPVRVVVIAPPDGQDQPWITGLESHAGVDVLARVGVLKHGIEVIEQLQPQLVIIDRTVKEIEEALHAVAMVASRALCIAMLPQQDMPSVRRLVAGGARDILIKPIGAKEVIASLQQVMQLEEARRERSGLPSLLVDHTGTKTGKVIALMGAKGGVGTTTVATNLAVALRQLTGKRVALADFSLQFGDVAVLLNVWSKHTVHDLAVHYQTLDETLLERVLMPHSSGVKVLQAPSDLRMAGEIGPKQIAAMVKLLRSHFDYVVMDCWSFVDEITETLLGNADQVLLVTTPDVPALKNTKQALDYFTGHGVQRDQMALVLNRFPSIKGIKLSDIQEHLRHPIQANLPSDGPTLAYAANEGIPVVQSHPQSWVAQSLLKLAAWVAGDAVKTLTEAPDGVHGSPTNAAQQPKRRFRLLKSSS